MFGALREELNKIALLEDDELDMMDDPSVGVGGDTGAADDELVTDIEAEDYEDEEDEIVDDVENGREEPSPEEIDQIVEALMELDDIDDFINEGPDDDYEGYDNTDDDDDYDDDYDYLDEEDDSDIDDDYESFDESNDCDDCDDEDDDDDYDDDDEDSIDFTDGVIGDGDDDLLEDDDDEEDDYEKVDIGGVTNSIHDEIQEDLDEELEDYLDEVLECGDGICGTSNDLCGDSSDMPDTDVPPSPQYSQMKSRCGVTGKEFVGDGNGNYKKFGKVFLDKTVMNSMTVDDDEFDAEGNDYDLYASAGNIYDDDENEEFYGIRNKVATDTLYGRHNIDNINARQLTDYVDRSESNPLDESVLAYLQYLQNS